MLQAPCGGAGPGNATRTVQEGSSDSSKSDLVKARFAGSTGTSAMDETTASNTEMLLGSG